MSEEKTIPEIIFLNFADAKIPTFKETRNKDYIKYGDDNRYPEYLTYLYNKSGKHGAIINGKRDYIYGEGFENGKFIVNRLKETLNDISLKAILDIEIYGGFKLEIVWNIARQVKEIYHVDYTTIRKAKDGGYFYKENWDPKNNREEEEYIPAFDPNNPTGSQIFSYDEYRPMTRFYPLPSYIAINNSIETDIEISKYWLSAIRNGMNPSKVIQFYTGDPGEEKKREIERSFKNKFAGAENAGKFVFIFNGGGKDKQVDIADISASDLDKMFIELNKSTQQEVFSGHRITSGMLFGIKTEGQLGGTTELATSYSIFQNTYSKPKAEAFSKEITYLLSFSPMAAEYELKPSDPIGVQFDVKDVINALPKQFVFEQLGIPKDQWGLENIGSDNRPTPTTPLAPSTTISTPAEMINDSLKNLSAKQLQHVNRVVRQYKQGKMAGPMAKTLLRNGYGLSENDINEILGVQAVAMSATENEDTIIGMFDECGESKEDFEILKSKRVSFSNDLEIDGDEEIWKQEAFKTYDVTRTEDSILELIRKDKRITPAVIAETIGQSEAYVIAKITNLEKRGYLEESSSTIGEDVIIERIVPETDILTPPPIAGTTPPAQIFIKYSYEGPQDSRNRPFCAKMLQLHRLYSRADIENISQRLGYSVFDRRGGFWRHKGTNTTTPYCRHNWKSNIVVKRGGAK